MNRYAKILLAAFLALATNLTSAAEVAGVRLEDSAKNGNTDLMLNGAGLRKKLFFKVYVAALYAPKKTANAAEIIESREPRRIEMHMLRDMDADTLINVLKEGLRQNHSESELAALKTDTERFEIVMRGIGNAKSGDLIVIDFSADGTSIGFNGQAKGGVAGSGFGKALLKVWIGDKPADAGLKQALLGG
jgi:hypothetical protein